MTSIDQCSHSPPIDVAVIVVNYRTPERSIQCLRALKDSRSAFAGFRVVLVDGGSDDGSAALLTEAAADGEYSEWVKFLPLPINGGFGWANNQAMLRELQAEDPPAFIHLLNPDAEIDAHAIAALRHQMLEQPSCGAAGSRIFDFHGDQQVSAFRFPTIASEFVAASHTQGLAGFVGMPPSLPHRLDLAFEADWVSGASVMLRSAALRQVGLFDDGFFLYFEEVELLSRFKRAGWSVWQVPQSVVVHEGGAATNVRWDSNAARPFYWYQSKRRLHYRLRGRAGALAAMLAWCGGRTLWRVRKLVQPGVRRVEVRNEASDMLQAWKAADRFDMMSFATHWQTPPSNMPAWMGRTGSHG